MGIGLVLLIWGVVAAVFAIGGTVIFGIITAYLTRKNSKDRKALIISAFVFPWGCLIWLAIVFVFQAFISIGFLHRDVGIGDSWDCSLPNGYKINMIDVTDHGVVYNPKTQSDGGIGEQEDAVFGVRMMQVVGPYIFGVYQTQEDDANHHWKTVNGYFELNANTGKQTKFSSLEGAKDAASKLGIMLKLVPIDTVYSQNRGTWFDIFGVLLLLVPPAAVFILLCRKIWQNRNA